MSDQPTASERPAGDQRAESLRQIAADVPSHLPARIRVVCFVALAAQRLRYCPFLAEIATALARSNSTITWHVAALADDGLVSHQPGATRCAITEAGRTEARIVLDAHRNPSKPVE